jgi:transcriptional regulator with XRE-family HTH domain
LADTDHPLPTLLLALRAWRLYRGLTQSKLAARSGLSEPYVVSLERGTRDFTGRSLLKLAQALDTPPGSLFEPPNDPADIWSVWDDLREQGRERRAERMMRAIRGKDRT